MIVTNSLTGGGAERSMNLVANELTRRGLTVALVPINAGPSDQVLPLCEVFPLARQWRGSLVATLTSFWNFNRLVEEWKPDLIVLNCDLPEFFGAFLFSRQKLIVVEHVNHPWITRQTFGRVVRKVLELRKTTWVAVSAHLKVWPNHRKPLRILLNPIVFKSLLEVSDWQTTEKPQKLVRLIFIGRLAEQKRPDWVLEIVAQAKLPVEFMGDGPMLEQLRNTATYKNLQATFSGQVLNPWLAVQEGDLLVVPSKYEGDGLVVIEALHHKIPILLADIPEFRRFALTNSNYCTDVDQFVKQITLFQDNLNDLLIPESLSVRLLNSRSLQSVGDAWEDFLAAI